MKNISRIIVTIALLFSVNGAICQSIANTDTGSCRENKIFIGVEAGAGIPLLNYGLPAYLPYNQDPAFQTGYAATGLHFNVNAGYYFNNDLGLMIKLAGNSNAFNANIFKARSSIANDTNVTASGSTHYIGSYLAGLVLRMPGGVASTDGKLSMNVYVLAGMMTLNASNITESHGSGSSITTLNATSTFGIDLGSTAIYSITKNMGICLNLDLMAGNFNFPSYTVKGTGDIPAFVNYTNKTSMSMALFNPSIGLVITL